MNLIIIPVVVDPHMTQRCIDSALAQDVKDVHVFVFGNGCVDSTMAFLRGKYQRDSRVTIFAHSSMQSLNTVWNTCLNHALSMEPYALVLNNDVEIRPDMFRLMRDDGGMFVTGVSVGNREELKDINPSSRSPHPCFSAFFIRRECWQKVGGFDESFWAYASDGDYHLRMDAAGIDAYAIAVPFYHETSSTIKTVDEKTRQMILKRADEDRRYFEKKWGFKVGSEGYYAAFRSARDNKYEKEGVL